MVCTDADAERPFLDETSLMASGTNDGEVLEVEVHGNGVVACGAEGKYE